MNKIFRNYVCLQLAVLVLGTQSKSGLTYAVRTLARPSSTETLAEPAHILTEQDERWRSAILELRETQGILSSQAQRVFGYPLRHQITSDSQSVGYHQLLQMDAPRIEPQEFAQEINRLSTEYHRFQHQLTVGTSTLSEFTETARFALTGLSSMAQRVLPTHTSIAVQLIENGANAHLDAVLSEFETASQNAARTMLAHALNDKSEEAVAQFRAAADRDPERALFLAMGTMEQIYNQFTSDITDSVEKDHVKIMLNQTFTKALAGFSVETRAMARLNATEIQKTTQNIVGINRSILNLQSAMNAGLSHLSESQQRLHEHLNQISTDLDHQGGQLHDINSKLGFLNQFFFGKMTPGEQLIALESGILDLSPQEQERRRAQIEAVQEISRIRETATDVLNGAQLAIKLAKSFDVDPEVIQSASHIVQTSSRAYQAFDKLLNGGGFLAAADAIFQVFGVDGPDLAEARHQEIMKHLGDLVRGQETVINNQKGLFENQKTLMNNQKLIYDQVVQLAKTVDSHALRMYEKLDTINQNVLTNREMILSILSENVRECELFLNPAHRRHFSGYDETARQFTSIDDLGSFFRNYGPSFSSCVKGLQRALMIWMTTRTMIFVQNQTGPDNTNQVVQDQNMNNLASYFIDRVLRDQPNAYLGLVNPISSFLSIDQSTEELKRVQLTAEQVSEQEITVNDLKKEVDFGTVKVLIENLLEVYPYIEITRSNGKLLTIEQILDDQGRSALSEDILRGALRVLNFNIAQESLRSGTSILSMMCKDLDYCSSTEPSAPQEIRQNQAIEALINFDELRNNFIRYVVHRKLAESETWVFSYEVGKGVEKDPFLLAKMLPGLDLCWSDADVQIESENARHVIQPKGWSVRISEKLYISLPAGQDVLEGKMIFRTNLFQLLDLRQKIVSLLVEMDLRQQLPSNTPMTVFNQLILGGY